MNKVFNSIYSKDIHNEITKLPFGNLKRLCCPQAIVAKHSWSTQIKEKQTKKQLITKNIHDKISQAIVRVDGLFNMLK